MCGILGITVISGTSLTDRQLRLITRDLFVFSESRGKEASGLVVCDSDCFHVLKSALPASVLLKRPEYEKLTRSAFSAVHEGNGRESYVTLIGHSRMATDGSQYDENNNQPVTRSGMTVVHNGIVVNNEEIWEKNQDITRHCQIDTEVIPALIRKFLGSGCSIFLAVQKTIASLKGMLSIALLLEDYDVLVLATNNGSLYTAYAPETGVFLFASEELILQRIMKRPFIPEQLREEVQIRKVEPNNIYIVDMKTIQPVRLSLNDGCEQLPHACNPRVAPRELIKEEGIKPKAQRLTIGQSLVGRRAGLDGEIADYLQGIAARFPYDTSWSDSLRRCSRCILPETMPFIRFDANGVCNYCGHYRPIPFKGKDALLEIADRHRRKDGKPDCVVGVSGGRDSLHSLHYVKNVLGLNPVAYTYDWGMVTDLARRNISRICGKLGVEHILISADISWKRKNVKKNVTAWLKKPHLGMIPLFMAGDKQYYYFLAKVRNQIGASLSILGENMLERTDFKTGFAGSPPHWDPEHVYTLPLMSKLKLMGFYGSQYLCNPGYINGSILDTLWAAASYYAMERNYLNLYTYIPWLEEEVNSTLINDYEFELATDTRSTWRIGDGTAAFYNYIYYRVAGFTENDTFRSNQIREGLISREDALSRVKEENKPRFETIFWYLHIIELGIALEEVLEKVGSIPRIPLRNAV